MSVEGQSTTVWSQDIVAQGASFLATVSENSNLDPQTRNAGARARDEILTLSANRRLRLAVIGEFSSGKSTFINALLGMEILASDFEPTTAVETRLTWGPSFQIRVRTKDGVRPFLGPYDVRADKLREQVAWYRQQGRNTVLAPDGQLRAEARGMASTFIREHTTEQAGAQHVEEVIVEVPSTYLEGAVEIIDTPGLNPGMSEADRRRHLTVTRRCVESADLAIFLLDGGGAAMKETERAALAEFAPKLSRIFFVVTKMDRLDEEEAEEMEEYVRRDLPTKLGVAGNQATIYFVSSLSKGPGHAQKYRENLAKLREDVVRFMHAARSQIVLERTSRSVSNHAQEVRAHVSRLAAAQRRELEQLQAARIADVGAMRAAVIGRATQAFAASTERFLREFSQVGGFVENCRNELWQHLTPVAEKEQVERTFAAVAGGIAQRQLIVPMSKLLNEWLIWCISQVCL